MKKILLLLAESAWQHIYKHEIDPNHFSFEYVLKGETVLEIIEKLRAFDAIIIQPRFFQTDEDIYSFLEQVKKMEKTIFIISRTSKGIAPIVWSGCETLKELYGLPAVIKQYYEKQKEVE